MQDAYKYLLDIAIILLSTKALGLVTRKFNMPQVVGALLAGLLLGPAFGVNILQQNNFIASLAEIGVIILMFSSGLETDLRDLKKVGLPATIIASMGVLIPLIGGTLVSVAFRNTDGGSTELLKHIFIGVILTATSVSITVETLKEMGKLNTKIANTVLSAAIIDDIMGIVVLTVVCSFADSSTHVGIVLLKIFLFFVFMLIAGIGAHYLFKKWFSTSDKDLRRYVIAAFVFCLICAYSAERFFGVSDITGAFFAGLALSGTKRDKYIEARVDTLSYMFLSPVFFASIGMKVVIPNMNMTIVLFAAALIFTAIITKIIGCFFAAKVTKFKNKEALQIAIGMAARGEVALIIANKGNELGLMNENYFGPIVIMVIFTAIVTPLLLKLAFYERNKDNPQSDGQMQQVSVEKAVGTE